MRWQFTKNGAPTSDPLFDDGIADVQPGDPDFSAAIVKQNLPAGADGFNYVGMSETPQ